MVCMLIISKSDPPRWVMSVSSCSLNREEPRTTTFALTPPSCMPQPLGIFLLGEKQTMATKVPAISVNGRSMGLQLGGERHSLSLGFEISYSWERLQCACKHTSIYLHLTESEVSQVRCNPKNTCAFTESAPLLGWVTLRGVPSSLDLWFQLLRLPWLDLTWFLT